MILVLVVISGKYGKMKREGEEKAFFKQWTLDNRDVTIHEEVGRGAHSVVYRASYRSM